MSKYNRCTILFKLRTFFVFCRISKDCLNNSFFSSALREWLEQVAASAFTPEYRVKMRADEKKRAILKAEDAWKSRFFEKDWGDR